jgi:transcriptional antiterminator NusG
MSDRFRWYIIHVYSGSENKVRGAIEELVEKKKLQDYISEILIPTEDAVEIKGGEKVVVDRKYFPGYILIRMAATDNVVHLIRTVPRVSGFLGTNGKPMAVSDAEVDRILKRAEESEKNPQSIVTYSVGDLIKVSEGPFASFTGYVDSIEQEKQKLTVSVMVFGRPTPIVLDYSQVEKQ